MAEKEVDPSPFKKLVSYDLSTPEFLKRLQSSGDVEEGEMASLFCEVIGDPVPKIKWFTEEGTEITEEDNQRFQMNYNLVTGRAELKIKKVLISDEQSYKCVATNDHGSAKTIGVLVIKSKLSYNSIYLYF